MQRSAHHPAAPFARPGAHLPAVVAGPTPRYGGELSPGLSLIVREVEREIGLNDGAAGDGRSLEELGPIIQAVARRLGFELGLHERDEVWAQIERDRKPFGVLQPFVEDPSISDIIVANHASITVQQGRRNCSTGAAFPSAEAYENFVERILHRAGASYSTKRPIADGMIGSFARIHAVHKSLCESGPYLTVRLNRYAAIRLDQLSATGLAPMEVLDYLGAVVRRGLTVLVVGEVGTGKTTLTRAIAASIPSTESILVIEDTPEIRLEHPQVRYLSTREANTEGVGRISPSECIRAGMRMAMNRIVFGEIRDAEAAEAFIDVCSSGHPGISTIHARSAHEAAKRLELFLGRAQRGVERSVTSEQIATAVNVIVHVGVCGRSGARRVLDVREIGPVADGVMRHRELFRYSLRGGEPVWSVVTKVSHHREALEEGESRFVFGALPAELTLARDDGGRTP